MTSFSHSLGLISCALQVAKSEHMIAVFSAASWLPQKRKFFLDKVSGLIAFSTPLSKSFDNLMENSIRPLAIRRKNYLFCGDDAAAQRAAVVYSLLATCKAHGVNERTWLEDVLRRITEYEQAGKDYAGLLPGNWNALSAK